MKKFKFEITLYESDLEGDEFWEEALERDGTGIADLKDTLIECISRSNLIVGSDRSAEDVVRLISYTEE